METRFAQNIKKWVVGVVSVLFFLGARAATAEAATVYFSPSSGTYTVGGVINTGVYVNTQDVAVNNADVVLDFPTDTLEVISVGKSGSIFSLWVEEPSFSNSSGTIRFNGGVPTPGFTGSGGKLVGISFRVKAAGTATVVCSSAAVRANDGLGTDVLNGCGQASFTLAASEKPVPPPPKPTPPPVTPPPAPAVKGVPAAPTVASSTHPNPARWYNNNDPVFSWTLPSSVTGVNVFVDRAPTTDPGTQSDGRFTTYDYTDADDGNWFFHIRLQNVNGWSPAVHFPFNVDLSPPALPIVRLVQQPTIDEPIASIVFDSEDQFSGVASFVVSVDGVDSERINPADVTLAQPYRLSALPAGTHSVRVVAYDQAGNVSPAGTLTYVVPAPPVVIVEPPAPAPAPATLGPWAVNPWINFWGLWILVTLILILIVLCLLLWHRCRQCPADTKETRVAIRIMKRKLATVEKQLHGLERIHSKRPLTDEEALLYRSLRGQAHEIFRSIHDAHNGMYAYKPAEAIAQIGTPPFQAPTDGRGTNAS